LIIRIAFAFTVLKWFGGTGKSRHSENLAYCIAVRKTPISAGHRLKSALIFGLELCSRLASWTTIYFYYRPATTILLRQPAFPKVEPFPEAKRDGASIA